MAYKSPVTNKYMGSSFAGRVNPGRENELTQLARSLDTFSDALPQGLQAYKGKKVEDAQERLEELKTTMSPEELNAYILKGEDPVLSNKWAVSVVDGQVGRFEAAHTIRKIVENGEQYNFPEQDRRSFYNLFMPDMSTKSSSFKNGFSVHLNDWMANDLMRDAQRRAEFKQENKINEIVTFYSTAQYENMEEFWTYANSLKSELPSTDGKKNFFASNEDINNDALEDSKEIETNVISDNPKSMGHGPAIRRMLDEHEIDPAEIIGTGKDGRITKTDVKNYLNQSKSNNSKKTNDLPSQDNLREVERVPMSRMRSTIARRLLSVSQETAMLTTFNEVDMQPIKNLRNEYGEDFLSNHGIKLGFMGFFVAASIVALKKYPIANASIDGDDVVYHGFQDISVAVSTDKGLVVPVIRDADMMTLPEIEKRILEFSSKAQDGKLSIEEMQGGTFTISNGGVFGSLLSTPILNAPQTAILGMHKIQDRPIVVDGKIEIRPMMYLALSYDHRLLDGKDAVSFLISIKEQLEKPERLLLNL